VKQFERDMERKIKSFTKKMEKWDPLQAPAVSSVVEYFNTVLQTTFPITVAAFQLFFMVDAVVVLGFMEHFFPEKADDPLFPSTMRPIEFLVLSVYTIFLQTQISGYAEPVEKYFAMLQNVHSLAPLLLPHGINGSDKLCLMVDYVEQINRPGAGSPKAARENYQRELESLIIPSDQLLCQKIQHNLDTLRAIELSQSVTRPNLMQRYIYTFLCLWFGIWFPISMWAILGFSTTIFLFPSFMYVLWGPSIHKFWLGSPWDDDRVFRESSHSHWASEFKERICVYFL